MKASTVINLDEDKWTEPAPAPGKWGFGMTDAPPNWWPAGLGVGIGGGAHHWQSGISVDPSWGGVIDQVISARKVERMVMCVGDVAFFFPSTLRKSERVIRSL